MHKFSLFGQQRKKIIVLIDIGSTSISAAYVGVDNASKDIRPIIYYSTRSLISLRDNITPAGAVADALTKATKDLLITGAPALARATNQTIYIDKIVISIAAPWQEVRVQTQQKIEKKSFRFTKSVMDDMVASVFSQLARGRVITNSMVVSISLNGYPVNNPFNVKTKEAKIVVLGSYVAKEIADCVTDIVTQAFHTDALEITAFAPIAYAVLRSLYPREQDILIIDITGEATDVVIAKNGVLTDIVNTKRGLNVLRKNAQDAGIRTTEPSESFYAIEHAVLIDKEHNARFTARMQQARALWLQDIAQILQALNARYVLPKNVFLLVDEEAVSFIKRQFDEAPIFKKIWLSNNPLSIISLDARHFSSLVTYGKGVCADPFLSILALYVAQQ